jgi:hypothetical protein
MTTTNETKTNQAEPTVDQAFDAFDEKLAKALEALQQFQKMDLDQIAAEGARLDSYQSREEFLADTSSADAHWGNE